VQDDEKKLPRMMSVPEMSRTGLIRMMDRSCDSSGETASDNSATRWPHVFPLTVGESQFMGTFRSLKHLVQAGHAMVQPSLGLLGQHKGVAAFGQAVRKDVRTQQAWRTRS
jgi:hypothetical protein